jgi:protein O-mannosyl-transferase
MTATVEVATAGTSRSFGAWVVLLAMVATLGVYSTTTTYSFIIDDYILFKNSPSLHSLSSIPRGFILDIGAVRSGSATVQGTFYRPLFLALSTLYFQVVGGSTFAWHLMSVLFAALVAGLAAALFLRLGFASWTALLAAVAFSLHPSHVGSVAWVSGLQEQLAGLFVLLAIVVLLGAAAARRPRRAVVISCVAFLCGLLSKEVALALLPMAVVWWWERRDLAPKESQRFGVAALAYTPIALVYLAVRLSIFGGFARPFITSTGVARGVSSIPLAFLTYLRILLWPVEFSWVRAERPVRSASEAAALVSVAMLIGLVVGAYFAVKRRPELLLPMSWVVIWLLPVMNFWALEPEFMVTDRYLYLPSLALPWALVVLIPKRAMWPVFVVLLALFTVQTLRYASLFVDSRTLTNELLKSDPESAFLLTEKARLLLVGGRQQEAERLFRRVLDLSPYDAYSLFVLGSLERDRGDFAAAETDYRRALVEEPNQSGPFISLAVAFARAGIIPKALALLNEATLRWPRDDEPVLVKALVLDRAGERQAAEAALSAALRRRPEDRALAGSLEQATARVAEKWRIPQPSPIVR